MPAPWRFPPHFDSPPTPSRPTLAMQSLLQLWDKEGGFDGLLGFSNGAAAAFLLAAHLQQDMVWRCGEVWEICGRWGHAFVPRSHSQPLPSLSKAGFGVSPGGTPAEGHVMEV